MLVLVARVATLRVSWRARLVNVDCMRRQKIYGLFLLLLNV